MRSLSLATAALLAMSLTAFSGCTSDNSSREAPGSAPVSFSTETPGDGASVSLRAHVDPLAPTHLVLEVVARGAADLHGAAFRMTWDPEALAFVEATNGERWSKQAVALAKEGAPGQLAVAWSERGGKGIDATSETVIGTLTFETRGRKGTSIAFKTERSQLVDKKGARVDAKWHGAVVAAR